MSIHPTMLKLAASFTDASMSPASRPPFENDNTNPFQSLSSLSLAFAPLDAFLAAFFSFFSFFLRFRSAFSSGVSPSCRFRFFSFSFSPLALGSSTSIASEVPLGAAEGAEYVSSLAVFAMAGCGVVPSNGAL
jgi:hypothetical protein